MGRWWFGIMLTAGVMTAASAAWSHGVGQDGRAIMMAQAGDADAPAPKPTRRVRAQQPVRPTSEVQPDLDAKDQLAPSQIEQPMPAAVPMPGRPAARRAATLPTAAVHAVGAHRAPAAARNIACSGAFGKESNHLKVATAFDSKNITFTDVDSGIGGKVPATVIYPSDPKRRLEVWWNNPATRSDTYLIVINGESNWVGPKGIHLGLSLQALEKLNRKPFKIKGFSKDNIAAVSDWQGGALAALPGGCKVGINLFADPKAPANIRSAATSDKEFASSDAVIQATKPTVGEIIIGY